MADSEIEAMSSLVGALDPLDGEIRTRVLRWAADRYGVAFDSKGKASTKTRTTSANNTEDEQEEEDGLTGDDPEVSKFEEFADLFDAASPVTEPERALVGAYWFQIVKQQKDIESFQINKELKNLGHGISTINRAFDRLKEKDPAQALQLKKSGKSQQARKKYKLTKAGIKEVEAMIKNNQAKG